MPIIVAKYTIARLTMYIIPKTPPIFFMDLEIRVAANMEDTPTIGPIINIIKYSTG